MVKVNQKSLAAFLHRPISFRTYQILYCVFGDFSNRIHIVPKVEEVCRVVEKYCGAEVFSPKEWLAARKRNRPDKLSLPVASLKAPNFGKNIESYIYKLQNSKRKLVVPK